MNQLSANGVSAHSSEAHWRDDGKSVHGNSVRFGGNAHAAAACLSEVAIKKSLESPALTDDSNESLPGRMISSSPMPLSYSKGTCTEDFFHLKPISDKLIKSLSASNHESGCHITGEVLFYKLTGKATHDRLMDLYRKSEIESIFLKSHDSVFCCDLLIKTGSSLWDNKHTFLIITGDGSSFRLYHSILYVYSLEDWVSGKLDNLERYKAESEICLAKLKTMKVGDDLEYWMLVNSRQNKVENTFYNIVCGEHINQALDRQGFIEKILSPLTGFMHSVENKDFKKANENFIKFTGIPLKDDCRELLGQAIDIRLRVQSSKRLAEV